MALLVVLAALLFPGDASAQLRPGDLLVLDQGGIRGRLFVVDPSTGQRRVLTNFDDASQGPLGEGSFALAVARGKVYVADCCSGANQAGGALFEVDPRTGMRRVVSDLSGGSVPGYLSYGLAADGKGMLFANVDRLDRSALVVRIDPRTDERTVVSDLEDRKLGGPPVARGLLNGLARHRNGRMAITAIAPFDSFTFGQLYSVQKESGVRKLITDFRDPSRGPVANFFGYLGLAFERDGSLLVNAGRLYTGAEVSYVLRVDPRTGRRTVLSDLFDPRQGPVALLGIGLAVEPSGHVVIGAYRESLLSSLVRIDPRTGVRTLLSNSDDPAQGPAIQTSVDIAVVPAAEPEGECDAEECPE